DSPEEHHTRGKHAVGRHTVGRHAPNQCQLGCHARAARFRAVPGDVRATMFRNRTRGFSAERPTRAGAPARHAMSSHRSADPGFPSLLSRDPHLYDLVFSDPDGSLVRLCRNAFPRSLPAPPSSALDIGCGTARHLEALAETVAECWGV